VLSGRDPRDSTSLAEPPTRCLETLSGDVAGLVIGLPREALAGAGCDPEVARAVEEGARELEKAGATLREVALPHTKYAVAAYYLICTAEASSNLARFDGVRYGRRAEGAAGLTEMYERSRSEGFGREVKRRILLGTYVLSAGYYDAYYRKAQQVRALLSRDFEEAFASCDALLTPTAPETAFALGERTADPLRMYLSDVYTVSINLTGVPALSLPCGFARGLPVGMQLVGRPRDEATPLRLAAAFQRRTDHHLRRPELQV
jgi:aspartyl-tRNA(Asn)/glutamyl-tRNA(Gln) amidotransferase subunit A